jgi:hypothetical protein
MLRNSRLQYASTFHEKGFGTAIRMNTNIVRVALCSSLFVLAAVAQDPPSRIARLNYIQGNVSMQPAGVDDWSQAIVNRPFTIGDSLYTDEAAQAELHMDLAVMRMGPQTSFSFLNLDDQTVQLKLTSGSMYFHVRNFGANQVFEVDTPNAAFTLLREGIYRFSVDPNGNTSFVVVRQGQAEITGGGQAFTLNPGNSVNLSGTDQLAYDVEVAPGPDQFDNWCSQRDYHEAHLQSVHYVSPSLIGYEDLDDYGDWQTVPNYGAIWYPRRVESGWAPYHNGHWAWVHPWGWTWVDDAAWGFAPFHYGRWAFVNGRWGWCPGPRPVEAGYAGPVVRAHYAPALVAFFGGSHWGVSLSTGGGGPSLGWVPLGYGEVYTPPYKVSQDYFRNVNVSNTTIDKRVNITNVYNTAYVNKTTNVTNVTVVNNNQRYVNMGAPGAVTAMPQSAFASGRPVARSAVSVAPAEVAKIQPGAVSVLAPAVAPTRQALTPAAGAAPAAHPPQQIVARQVVAKHTPAPAPASFAAEQSYMQQHPGQPLNAAAMRQAAPTRPASAVVKQAPVAKAAVQVHPGQRFANPVEVSRPAGQPGQYNKPLGTPPSAAQQHPPTPKSATPAVRTQTPPQPPRAPQPTQTTPAARPTLSPRPVPAAKTEPKPAVGTTPSAKTPAPPPHRTTSPHPSTPEERKKEEEKKKQPQ